MKNDDIIHYWYVKELDTNKIIYVGFSYKECEDYYNFLIENDCYEYPKIYISNKIER